MPSTPEPESQSFIFRIWREEPFQDGSPLDFRGHMTCLLDGTRVYFSSWIEIQAFINSYLETGTESKHTVPELPWTGEAS
ncbi:hypothetical protein BH23ACT12_BH23ACT12_11690 [soil metagenome]